MSNTDKQKVSRLHVLLWMLDVILLIAVVGLWILGGFWQYVFGILCLAAAVILTHYIVRTLKRRTDKRVLQEAMDLQTEYQQYITQWEVPFAILSSGLKVLWCNEAFRKLVNYEDVSGKTPDELGIEWGQEKPEWDPVSHEISVGSGVYRGLMSSLRLRDPSKPTDSDYTLVYSLSLTDITRERSLERKTVDQQSVVALVYVDNYDQVVASVDESQRPLFEAMIFRQIADWSTGLEGIMMKLENDRYQIVFPRRSMEALYKNEFRILEDVKQLDSGSRLQATISIGVGIDEEIEKARTYARMGVDLAMGRGGDQAVVKTKDEQKFYGGLSTSTENTTRVRARLTAYALRELVEASDHVLVMGHANPDLDAFGSALGIYRAVHELKKPANIVMSPDKHAAVDFLYDKVKESYEAPGILMDLEEAMKVVGPNTLLVLVDVNRKVIVQYPELLDAVPNVVVIDHHRAAADAISGCAISYVEPFASSASEMVTELLQYIVESPNLTPVEADGLFAGIALDTKNFTVKTGVRTFEAAAYLRRRGADSVRVRKMFKNDMGDYKAKAQIVAGAELYRENMAIATWSSQNPNATTVAAQAADELLDIHGVMASFVITEMDHQQINISARSLGEINVQLVMEELGGGGHLSIAGAQMKDVSLEEARQKVVDAIDRIVPDHSAEK